MVVIHGPRGKFQETRGIAEKLPGPSARESIEESLGRAVRRRREESGMTQVDLAARSGLTQAAVSRLECGRNMPTLPLLERIAEALGAVLYLTVRPGRGVTISFLGPEEARAAEDSTALTRQNPYRSRPVHLAGHAPRHRPAPGPAPGPRPAG
ncbi:helix-turn-helix domain-containing protein [Streptomyces sp. enrichment culture]|uniref:helix-turn-helix domain-containing protein n=1 Tax=Streptomyces sp. enrichment culture TaxID=1795815 RepID=UPI003F55CB5D